MAVLLVGRDEGLRTKLEDLARMGGIAENIEFLGERPNVTRVLRRLRRWSFSAGSCRRLLTELIEWTSDVVQEIVVLIGARSQLQFRVIGLELWARIFSVARIRWR